MLNALPISIFFLFSCLPITHCYQYAFKDQIFHDHFFFSEKNMFASHKGPFLLEQHLSYIKYSTIVSIYSSIYDDKLRLAFAIFGAQGKYIEGDLKHVCIPGGIDGDRWAVAAESQIYSPYYVGQKTVIDQSKALNGKFDLMYNA